MWKFEKFSLDLLKCNRIDFYAFIFFKIGLNKLTHFYDGNSDAVDDVR